MVKHFSNQLDAEIDLRRHGFRLFSVGKWIKPGFVATIHPIAGSSAVRVAYAENANA